MSSRNKVNFDQFTCIEIIDSNRCEYTPTVTLSNENFVKFCNANMIRTILISTSKYSNSKAYSIFYQGFIISTLQDKEISEVKE